MVAGAQCKWRSCLITLFLALVITATLINSSNWFIYASQASYFSYVILVSFLLSITGIIILKFSDLVIPLPIILVLVFGFYVLVHGKVISENLNPRHTYLVLSSLSAVAFYLLFKINNYKTSTLLWLVSFIALGESLICLAQYTGWVKSSDLYFAVTGSWVNPNVTAMFLSMALPAVLSLCFIVKKREKTASILIVGFMLAAILLLKCRTAYIGAAVSTTIVLNYRYQVWQYLSNKRNRTSCIALAALALLVLIPLSLQLYKSKQASADGRMLVWKVSFQMILEKPFTGYGYGMFEQAYNLAQAKYVQNGKLTGEELRRADHVRMAYNEFLENTVEGGLTGLILFAGIVFSLLLVHPRSSRNHYNSKITDRNPFIQTVEEQQAISICTYAGIVAFVVMSLFNFSMQAIPAACLFMLYISIYSVNYSFRSHPRPMFLTGGWHLSSSLRLGIGAGCIIGGVFICFYQTENVHADLKNKHAADLAAKGDLIGARTILQQLESVLPESESYWRNYGQVLFELKNYPEALMAFNRAKTFSSNPDLYFKSGLCHERSGNYSQAATDYLMAKNIQPARFKHRMALMNVYLKSRNAAAAGDMAQEILVLKPKIPSDKVRRYKSAARLVLKRLEGDERSQKMQLEIQRPAYLITSKAITNL